MAGRVVDGGVMSDVDLIRNTLGRFCQALDSRQFEAWAATFTPDGIFNRLHGRPAILDMIQHAELASQPDLRRQHAVTNSVIEVSGETATATSDLTMFSRVGDGPMTIRLGRYHDRLARQPDGQWLFVERRLDWLD
jgi:ketosteroid isomerase-like protein